MEERLTDRRIDSTRTSRNGALAALGAHWRHLEAGVARLSLTRDDHAPGALRTRARRALLAALLIALAACAYSSATAAANTWTVQHTTPNGAELSDVSCPTTSNCWTVSYSGTIFATSDGGATWSPQSSGGASLLSAVSCPTTSSCWAVSYYGIIATTDGGATWTSQNYGILNLLYDISCPTASRCWAVGSGGAIVTTSDGGATWSRQNSATADTLLGVYCPTASNCWAVGDGEVDGDATITATSNGGLTWTRQSAGKNTSLYAVFCHTASNCWALGESPKIIATTDGGATWAAQYSGTGDALFAISCPTNARCWAVTNAGNIITTANGGKVWTPDPAANTTPLFGLACPSEDACWAVGRAETILAGNDPTAGNLADRQFDVTPAQAQAALQASHPETIAPSTPLAVDNGGSDPEIDSEQFTLQPAIDASGSPLVSSGTAVDSAIARDPGSGVAMAPGGAPALAVQPAGVSSSASQATVVNGAAALYANTAPGVDTVLRPITNGVGAYQQIRSYRSPQSFTSVVAPAVNAADLAGSLPDVLDGLSQGPIALQQIDAQTVAVIQQPVAVPDPTADIDSASDTTAGQGDSGQAPGPDNDAGTQYDESERVDEVAQQQTNGQTIAVMSAPKATDSKGRAVPVSLKATGHAVTMSVLHSRQYSYPVVAASRTTTRSPSCQKSLTYRDAMNPYPVPYKPGSWAIPQCRKMVKGGTDHKPAGLLNNGYPGDDPSNGLKRTGQQPIADSYGNTIANAKYNSITGRWDIYDAAGTTVIDDASRVVVGGHGCMFTPAHADKWFITAFVGSSKALRAFVLKASFGSPGALGSPPGSVGRYSTGCGSHAGHHITQGGALTDPGLDAIHYTRHGLDSSGRVVSNGSYNSYNAHKLGPNTVLALSASSTSVWGGGIVRAVLPISGPAFAGKPTDGFRVYDRLQYADPNVFACGDHKQARWRFGQVRHGSKYIRMYGYVPTRLDQGPRC
jgi:photosystem II stability/assembly factor-like uncharacterized protein